MSEKAIAKVSALKVSTDFSLIIWQPPTNDSQYRSLLPLNCGMLACFLRYFVRTVFIARVAFTSITAPVDQVPSSFRRSLSVHSKYGILANASIEITKGRVSRRPKVRVPTVWRNVCSVFVFSKERLMSQKEIDFPSTKGRGKISYLSTPSHNLYKTTPSHPQLKIQTHFQIQPPGIK